MFTGLFPSNNARRSTVTDWTAANHTWHNNASGQRFGSWWLRSADSASIVWFVFSGGNAGNGNPSNTGYGLRPAMSLALE
jgi:hypothetical protein